MIKTISSRKNMQDSISLANRLRHILNNTPQEFFETQSLTILHKNPNVNHRTSSLIGKLNHDMVSIYYTIPVHHSKKTYFPHVTMENDILKLTIDEFCNFNWCGTLNNKIEGEMCLYTKHTIDYRGARKDFMSYLVSIERNLLAKVIAKKYFISYISDLIMDYIICSD